MQTFHIPIGHPVYAIYPIEKIFFSDHLEYVWIEVGKHFFRIWDIPFSHMFIRNQVYENNFFPDTLYLCAIFSQLIFKKK